MECRYAVQVAESLMDYPFMNGALVRIPVRR